MVKPARFLALFLSARLKARSVLASPRYALSENESFLPLMLVMLLLPQSDGAPGFATEDIIDLLHATYRTGILKIAITNALRSALVGHRDPPPGRLGARQMGV